MDINILMDKEIRDLISRAQKYNKRVGDGKSFFTKFGGDIIKKSLIRNGWNKKGVQIPPFLIASIATSCNLNCAGCYAKSGDGCMDKEGQTEMSEEQWSKIFHEADSLGVSFILLSGGEPSLRPDVMMAASECKNIIFPIFTNGVLAGDATLGFYKENQNIIPIVSIEGDDKLTDARRGPGVSAIVGGTIAGLHNRGIMFGTSITVTTENYLDVSSPQFIDGLYEKGCGAVILVEYVPMDEQSDDLVLDEEKLRVLEKRAEELRDRYEDMIIISFPGDEDMMGGCLAAGRGFFHISPGGEAQACPFSPYSKQNLRDNTILDVLKSDYFKDLRKITKDSHEHYGGCTLYNERASVKKLMTEGIL